MGSGRKRLGNHGKWNLRETKLIKVYQQNDSIKCVDRVFHTSANLCKLFLIIIFIHNFQNRKACEVIVHYLTEIFQ